jgi:hypothetical protein
MPDHHVLGHRGPVHPFTPSAISPSSATPEVRFPSSHLGLHFDGKQFRQWLDMLKTENIAVGVSGGKISKFLGILPCASANASDITEQIREIVAEWGLWDNIFFMCYDTANTNSGEFTGTIKT